MAPRAFEHIHRDKLGAQSAQDVPAPRSWAPRPRWGPVFGNADRRVLQRNAWVRTSWTNAIPPQHRHLTLIARPTYCLTMDDWFGLQGGLVVMGLLAAVPGCKDPDTDTTTGDTTSTEPGSTGDTGGTSTSSGATGDTPTGSGTGSATGTTGDAEVPPVCVSYGAKLAECNIEPEPGEPLDAEQTCARILMDSEVYGADCVQSLEAFFACPLDAQLCAAHGRPHGMRGRATGRGSRVCPRGTSSMRVLRCEVCRVLDGADGGDGL
jgi:hypothetical protein